MRPIQMSRGDFCALVIILLLAGFIAGSIYVALFYKPRFATPTVTLPVYEVERSTVTVTETVTMTKTILPGQTIEEGAEAQPPQAAAVIEIRPLSYEETIRFLAFGCPAGVNITTTGYFGALGQPITIGDPFDPDFQHRLTLLSAGEGSTYSPPSLAFTIQPSKYGNKLVYLEFDVSGDYLRYVSLALVNVSSKTLPEPGSIYQISCEEFAKEWNPLERYEYRAVGGSLVGLVTGQREMTYTGRGIAIFEVPSKFNLTQFALEIRTLRMHRVGGYEHYLRDVMIIPLREAR